MDDLDIGSLIGNDASEALGDSLTSGYGFTTDPNNTYGFQTDGTINTPTLGQTISTGDSQAGNGSQITSGVMSLLNNGLSAFTKIYTTGQLLDYAQYSATQAGLVAQGQAQTTAATTELQMANSNRMVLILGGLALLALMVHKG